MLLFGVFLFIENNVRRFAIREREVPDVRFPYVNLTERVKKHERRKNTAID
jgi:hypothetical protein